MMVIVDRDFSNGTYTHFKTNLPDSLSGKISQDEFDRTVTTINEIFREAEEYSVLTFIEAFVGVLSFFTIYICFTPKYRRMMKQLERYIQSENVNVYNDKGIELINPLRNGLLHLSLDVK
eukprot:TRINITY_DN9048_c0_g1_i1.p1 TRINITY_DN9048_c0_g1~~TRINITY_DN9048_c0_g1_i1.p1  ORF type:complete len:120 (+),score=25.91 TRINITY_DN9048_c0_g1_i1:50-409(+)